MNASFGDMQARPGVDPGARIYAVGDLHGRHDLMMVMLERIVEDFESRRDGRRCEIVFLGDYVDRGDNPRLVIDALMQISSNIGAGVVALRGNHEAALLDFIDAPVRNSAWLGFGALQTIADYGVAMPPRTPSETNLIDLRDALEAAMGDHLKFLRALPLHRTSGDVIFVHAGIAAGDGETLRNERVMMWGDSASDPDWPVPGKLIVHGHYDAPSLVDRPGRICVDTGAYYSGQLTAAVLDEGHTFMSVRK